MDVYGHLLPGMQEEAAAKTEAGLRDAITANRKVGKKPGLANGYFGGIACAPEKY
jgi:hypothetical protein